MNFNRNLVLLDFLQIFMFSNLVNIFRSISYNTIKYNKFEYYCNSDKKSTSFKIWIRVFSKCTLFRNVRIFTKFLCYKVNVEF